jgi:hypothetical protein
MRPVFVGGCPRSGTTLLGSMLGAHGRCLAIPESQFIVEVLRELKAGGFDAERLGRRITGHFRFKTWAVDMAPPDTAEAAAIQSYAALIEWFVSRYGQAVSRPDREIWIEHSPFNAQYFGTLLEHFPDARLVHIVRDGRATAASVMKLAWGPNEAHLAAPWWAHRLSFGLAAETRYGPERVARVRYEDLVVEPRATLEALCEFLGLEFEEDMLAANGLRVPEYTTEWHKLVGSRPDAARIEAWREDLEPRQIEIFESITGDLLSYLGYQPDFGLQARPISRREKIMPFLREHLFRRRSNRARTKRKERRIEANHTARATGSKGVEN